MLHTFDKILTIISYSILISPLLGVISFLMLIFFRRHKKKNLFIWVGVFFFTAMTISFVLLVTLTGPFQQKVYDKLISFIELNYNEITVKVNDTVIKNPNLFLKELKLLSDLPYHHSHPKSDFKIQLIAGTEFKKLTISQDSENENEYWVFDDDYRMSSMNNIGRIISPRFIELLPRNIQVKLEIKKYNQLLGPMNLSQVFFIDKEELQRDSMNTQYDIPIKVKVTYLPTGDTAFGTSYNNQDENYLFALKKIHDKIN